MLFIFLTDPDYSAVYVTLQTDVNELQGFGLTFTIGRGNEIVKAAVDALKVRKYVTKLQVVRSVHEVINIAVCCSFSSQPHILNRTLSSITSNFAQFWRDLVSDGQLRWLGPEKGVMHLVSRTRNT